MERLNRVPVQQGFSVRVVRYKVMLSCVEIFVFYLIINSTVLEFSSQSCQYLRLHIIGGKITNERGTSKDLEGNGVPYSIIHIE